MTDNVQQSAADATTIYAKRKRGSEFVGVGCLLQGLGLLIILGSFATGPGILLGIPLGIILLVAGGRKAIIWRCGHCGNRLADKKVKICPTCHAILK